MIRHELVRILKKFFYHKEKVDELLTDKHSIQIQKSQISDFPESLTPSSHTHTKSDISDFPSSMTPTNHTHQKVDVTDFNHTHQKEDISDFTHTHTISQITSLQSDLDNKMVNPVKLTTGNIDTLLDSGFYWINHNNTAQNISGFPIPNKSFVLLVDGGENVVRQFATYYLKSNPRCFVRIYDGWSNPPVWGEWKELAFNDKTISLPTKLLATDEIRDLNNEKFRVPGFYYLNSNDPDAIAFNNLPISGKAGTLMVDGNEKVVRQFFTVYKNQGMRTFVRMYSGYENDWGDWKELSFTNHTHSQSDITNFDHNHGSLSNNGILNDDADNVNKVAVTDANHNLKTINKLPFANLNISKGNITSLGIPGTNTMAASDWENMTDSLTNLPSGLRGHTYFYVNKKLRIAAFRFGASFHSAQADQYYYYPNESTALIPSLYRPRFLASGALNQVGSVIVDTNGVVAIVLGVSWDYTGNRTRDVYGTCIWFY